MKHSYRFEIVDGQIAKIDEVSEEVLGVLKPRGTSIVQVLPLGGQLVVREDYYEFPYKQSNVYCVSGSFQPIWNAELPSWRDAYANPVLLLDGWLHCASWNGMSCTIDPSSGRIVKKVFTK